MSKMTQEEYHSLNKMIRGVARWYQRRCYWVDFEDMVNEGWIWAIKGRAKYYDLPEWKRLVPLTAYCRTFVHRYVRDRVIRDGTIVKAGRFKNRKMLPGHRAHKFPMELLEDTTVSPERATASVQVHTIVMEITDGLPLARRVILEGLKPREVAKDEGVRSILVSRQLYKARQRAQGRPDLKDLLTP